MQQTTVVFYGLAVLFLGSCILYFVTTPHTYSIVGLVEYEFDDSATDIRFCAQKDSLSISSLKGYLLSVPENTNILSLYEQMAIQDTLNTPEQARIVSINGVPWQQILYSDTRKQLIKDRSYYNPQETFSLELEFRGKIYHAVIPKIKLKFKVIFDSIKPTIFLFFVFLLMGISSNFMFSKNVYFVFWPSVLFLVILGFSFQLSFHGIRKSLSRTFSLIPYRGHYIGEHNRLHYHRWHK